MHALEMKDQKHPERALHDFARPARARPQPVARRQPRDRQAGRRNIDGWRWRRPGRRRALNGRWSGDRRVGAHRPDQARCTSRNIRNVPASATTLPSTRTSGFFFMLSKRNPAVRMQSAPATTKNEHLEEAGDGQPQHHVREIDGEGTASPGAQPHPSQRPRGNPIAARAAEVCPISKPGAGLLGKPARACGVVWRASRAARAS